MIQQGHGTISCAFNSLLPETGAVKSFTILLSEGFIISRVKKRDNSLFLCSLKLNNDGEVLGQADTVARVLDSNADVAILTPGSAPGVTDDPVFFTGVTDTPTDHVDGVINAGWAASGVEDTRLIVHEVVVSGGDSNRDRGGLEGSLPLSGAPALLDAGVALGLDTSVRLARGFA